jgi:hypothetical protein
MDKDSNVIHSPFLWALYSDISYKFFFIKGIYLNLNNLIICRLLQAQCYNITNNKNTCRAIIGEHNNKNLATVVQCSVFSVQSGRHADLGGLLLRATHLQAWATVGQAIAHATSGSHPNRDPPLLWNDQRRSWHTSVQLLTSPINFCLQKLYSTHIREYLSTCDAQMPLFIDKLNYVRQTEAHQQYRQKCWLNHFGELGEPKSQMD